MKRTRAEGRRAYARLGRSVFYYAGSTDRRGKSLCCVRRANNRGTGATHRRNRPDHVGVFARPGYESDRSVERDRTGPVRTTIIRRHSFQALAYALFMPVRVKRPAAVLVIRLTNSLIVIGQALLCHTQRVEARVENTVGRYGFDHSDLVQRFAHGGLQSAQENDIVVAL